MNIALVTRFDWKAGYNGYLAGFAAEFDPDGVFKSFVTGASDNNMAYSSPKVDELLREGRATEDPAKRKAAYQAFEVAYAASAAAPGLPARQLCERGRSQGAGYHPRPGASCRGRHVEHRRLDPAALDAAGRCF